ncbi:TPA: hypothetical protein ACYDG9_004373 [Escherichia coli]
MKKLYEKLPVVVQGVILGLLITAAILLINAAILTIPLVFWFMKKQCQRVETGKIGDEGYSWERGNPKYRPTMVWDSKGDINLLIMPLVGVLALWGVFIIGVVTNMTWLKIWLAPKLYLIEYAASLVK